MLEALLALKSAGTRFLVAGRADASPATGPGSGAAAGGCDGVGGRFLTLTRDLAPSIPPLLRPLFVELPEAAFRLDVSSTQIRAAAAAAALSADVPALASR